MAVYPELAPSTRFRIHQFLPHLAREGIEVRYDVLLDRSRYAALRGPAGAIRRSSWLLRAMEGRRRRLAGGDLGDVVLVLKQLAPLFPGPFLRRLTDTGTPLVYDFDDSVFLPKVGGSRIVSGLSRPREAFRELCRSARVVLPGNEFLADWARGVVGDASPGPRIQILPTVVDTDRFVPGPLAPPDRPVVGWVGSHSTLPYLMERSQVFRKLARRVSYRLRVVSSAPPPPIPGVDMEFVRWTPEGEVSAFHGLSVGVYPLTDDHWSRGKCGFKAIQYGACGVPVVASPVGVLRDIVIPDETGFWAESDEEWCRSLENLLTHPDDGARMGAQGRALVEDRYSLRSGLPILRDALIAAAGTPPAAPPIAPEPAEAPCAASPAS